jgi:type II secretory ATPase GspE/PulE/Tfp pilus assembly ATPase PilB-like protein
MVRWLRKAFGPNWLAAIIVLIVVIGAAVAVAWQIRERQMSTVKETPQKVAEEKTPTKETQKETKEVKKETEKVTPQPEKKEEPKKEVAGETKIQSYKFVAQRGEGLTHLARKALKRYLTEEATDLHLTPEHKVYIEDYIQKRLGGRWLRLGEEVEISFDLIKEGIDASQKLKAQDLENLKKYSARVPSLIY